MNREQLIVLNMMITTETLNLINMGAFISSSTEGKYDMTNVCNSLMRVKDELVAIGDVLHAMSMESG